MEAGNRGLRACYTSQRSFTITGTWSAQLHGTPVGPAFLRHHFDHGLRLRTRRLDDPGHRPAGGERVVGAGERAPARDVAEAPGRGPLDDRAGRHGESRPD